MVNSILDITINYHENRYLDYDDKNYDATAYEIELLGMEKTIALGQAKYGFEKKNIIYFPIYLIKNGKVEAQIGLYEIFKNSLINILDKDGDVNLNALNPPLFYSFAYELLNTSEEKEKITNLNKEIKEQNPEKEEELLESNNINWIQKFFKNKNFNIIKNNTEEGCIFNIIRDSLEIIGKNITIKELKQGVISNITQPIFEKFLQEYNYYKSKLETNDIELKKMIDRNTELKNLLYLSKDIKLQNSIVKEGGEIKKNYNSLKENKKFYNEKFQLYSSLNNIKNIFEFKELLKSCKFWGSNLAIIPLSILEKILNIKFIILSEEAYNDGNLNDVLQCNSTNFINDDGLDEIDFLPSYYIILSQNKWHFNLISYKKIVGFTFETLPKEIKILIKEKCLEGNGSSYRNIKEFKNYFQDDKEIEEIDPFNFEEDTVLLVSDRLSNKLPGSFINLGEKIDKEKESEFIELSKIKDWRKKLFELKNLSEEESNKNIDKDLIDILLKTKNAALKEFTPGKKPKLLNDLMKKRKKFKREN